MRIIFDISILLFWINVFRLIYGLWIFLNANFRKKCSVKTEATLVEMTKSSIRDAGQSFIIEYEVDGTLHKVSIPSDNVEEGISFASLPGTKLTIWYNPKNVREAIISEDMNMPKATKSSKKTIKSSIKWIAIFFILIVFSGSRI